MEAESYKHYPPKTFTFFVKRRRLFHRFDSQMFLNNYNPIETNGKAIAYWTEHKSNKHIRAEVISLLSKFGMRLEQDFEIYYYDIARRERGDEVDHPWIMDKDV